MYVYLQQIYVYLKQIYEFICKIYSTYIFRTHISIAYASRLTAC